MIVETIEEEREWGQFLASPLSILYGIIIMIWITLFHESWKRKQNYIANEWLVRGFEAKSSAERIDFKHEMTVDPDIVQQWKVATKDAYKT